MLGGGGLGGFTNGNPNSTFVKGAIFYKQFLIFKMCFVNTRYFVPNIFESITPTRTLSVGNLILSTLNLYIPRYMYK